MQQTSPQPSPELIRLRAAVAGYEQRTGREISSADAHTLTRAALLGEHELTEAVAMLEQLDLSMGLPTGLRDPRGALRMMSKEEATAELRRRRR